MADGFDAWRAQAGFNALPVLKKKTVTRNPNGTKTVTKTITKTIPPGLAKKGGVPPGLAKKLKQGGPVAVQLPAKPSGPTASQLPANMPVKKPEGPLPKNMEKFPTILPDKPMQKLPLPLKKWNALPPGQAKKVMQGLPPGLAKKLKTGSIQQLPAGQQERLAKEIALVKKQWNASGSKTWKTG